MGMWKSKLIRVHPLTTPHLEESVGETVIMTEITIVTIGADQAEAIMKVGCPGYHPAICLHPANAASGIPENPQDNSPHLETVGSSDVSCHGGRGLFDSIC